MVFRRHSIRQMRRIVKSVVPASKTYIAVSAIGLAVNTTSASTLANCVTTSPFPSGGNFLAGVKVAAIHVDLVFTGTGNAAGLNTAQIYWYVAKLPSGLSPVAPTALFSGSSNMESYIIDSGIAGLVNGNLANSVMPYKLTGWLRIKPRHQTFQTGDKLYLVFESAVTGMTVVGSVVYKARP